MFASRRRSAAADYGARKRRETIKLAIMLAMKFLQSPS